MNETPTDYLAPPAFAALAFAPAYRFLLQKTARQIGEPVPKVRIIEGLKGGFSNAHLVGAVVGTQLIFQDLIQKQLAEKANLDKGGIPNLMLSSAAVAGISVPFLAALNSRTLQIRPLDALKRLNMRQTGAITLREMGFLAGFSFSSLLTEELKPYLGDSKFTGYAAGVITGATGSIIGHPADTYLTWDQANQAQKAKLQSAKIEPISLKRLLRYGLRGAGTKAMGTASFTVLYKVCNDIFSSLSG